jgi:phosphocarrier protein HPr
MSHYAIDSAVILDPVGLHARPAVKVSKMAKKYASTVEVSDREDGAWINAKSTNALMKMKAPHGMSLFVRANGDDALHAVSEIISLIRREFRDKSDG